MSVRLLALVLLALNTALFPSAAGAQQERPERERQEPVPVPLRELPGVQIPEMQFQKFRNWTIFGRVTTLDGQAVSAAKVRIELGSAQRPRTLQTDIRGQFTTEFGLDAKLYSKLQVQALATKADYRDAWEMAEFEANTGTREILLVLREAGQDFTALPQSILIESLAGRLRNPGAEGPQAASARKDYAQGARRFLEAGDARGAVPFLSKVVSREPGCAACRTLLSLALLQAGSWVSATRQLSESVTAHSAETPAASRPEPLLLLGVLESWRHRPQSATGWFLRALEVQPADPLALQELGRALILQNKWEDAEKYLQEALQRGASPEARLLRAQALWGTGDAEAAQAELKAFLGGRQPKDLNARVRPVYLELQEQLQLRSYGETKSLVSQSFEELSRAVPELKGLEPASSQEGLPQLLERIGESVDTFFRNFPNTISLEDIHEELLDRKGKVMVSQDRRFNYLFLAAAEKAGLGLDEYRATPEGARVPSSPDARYFMRTAGFAAAPLVLIPAYQAGCAFRLLGRQTIKGRATSVLVFAQQPGKAQALTTFNAEGKSLAILMQGIAWVDTNTCQIIRMHREILKSPPQSRLERLTTEINFAEVQFKGMPAKFWLPHEVTVTVHWKKRFFQNRHHYSDFRLFKVETEEKRKSTTAVPESRSPEPEDALGPARAVESQRH